jgi:hypothetical protein
MSSVPSFIYVPGAGQAGKRVERGGGRRGVRDAQGDSRWRAPACGLVRTIASDANLQTMARPRGSLSRPTFPLA